MRLIFLLFLAFSFSLKVSSTTGFFVQTSGEHENIIDELSAISTVVKAPLANSFFAILKTQGNAKELEHLIQNSNKILFHSNLIVSESGEWVAPLPHVFIKTSANADALFQALGMSNMVWTYHKSLTDIIQISLPYEPDDKVLNKILNHPSVEFAERDHLFPLHVTTNDPFYDRLWAINNQGLPVQGNGNIDADMDVDSAWTITSGNKNITIAILDSGVDTTHADLVNNLVSGIDALEDSTDGHFQYEFPNDAHGTACAGIIGAEADNNEGLAGVAHGCNILPIRLFTYIDLSGNVVPFSTGQAMAEAITFCADNNVDVMSNSWGLTPDFISFLPGGTQIVEIAISYAYANGRNGKGCAMFFSSGNENDSSVIWPSSLPETFAVTATSMCDERKNPSDCSGENWGGNYNTGLDFGAPGVRVFTTDIMGARGYSTADYYQGFNGTSAACPNAAGVAGLMLSVNPNLLLEEIRMIMGMTADKVGGYSYNNTGNFSSWSEELGYGRVNAYKAVQMSNVGVGVEEVNDLAPLAYPTISNGLYQLNSMNEDDIEIYSLNGKRMRSEKSRSQLDITELPAGMYLLKMGAKSTRIIKQR